MVAWYALQCIWQAWKIKLPSMRRDRDLTPQIMEDHKIHGWIIASLLREMAGLEGEAMFECVESKFSFARCLRQGSVEAPRLWQKMATQLLAKKEEEWVNKELVFF